MRFRRVGMVLMSLLTAGVLLRAQSAPAPNTKPITQEGLTAALHIGGLTSDELAGIIKQRGVAFQLTDQVESELRAAGATDTVIEAVRANYRPPAPPPAPPAAAPAPPAMHLGPLSENEILTLLQVGTPSPRVAQIVDQRGVNFSLTPAIMNELTKAGADPILLTALDAASSKFKAKEAATEEASVKPEPSSKPATHAPETAPKITSLKEVHRLYIEKMNNKLDVYLRTEIMKQLPGRFEIVVDKQKADAMLMGTGEQTKDVGSALTAGYLGLTDTATGSVSIVSQSGIVLWSAEAGDRTLLFGPLARGGPPEVASRLVQNLKKALREE